MKIARWVQEEHSKLIEAWEGFRVGEGLYPPTGFVVDDCVVGFLYRTDAPRVGFLDGVSADPNVSKFRRVRAIHRLCLALVSEADALGIQLLWAHTSPKSMVRICEQHGFKIYTEGNTALMRVA